MSTKLRQAENSTLFWQGHAISSENFFLEKGFLHTSPSLGGVFLSQTPHLVPNQAIWIRPCAFQYSSQI